MNKRIYDHIKIQKENLKQNIDELDEEGSQKDLAKVDKMYSDFKLGNEKSGIKILEELAEKYNNKHKKNNGLEETAIITSIITSILLSISLAIGIHSAYRVRGVQ